MRTIWKYPLKIIDAVQDVSMPKGAKIVFVNAQDGLPTLWVEGETENISVRRFFKVHGTGHPIRMSESYVGSTIINPFVWHVYECP